jgi:hypothetical protein
LQAKENTAISDLPLLSKELIEKLQKHYWVNNLGRYDQEWYDLVSTELGFCHNYSSSF